MYNGKTIEQLEAERIGGLVSLLAEQNLKGGPRIVKPLGPNESYGIAFTPTDRDRLSKWFTVWTEAEKIDAVKQWIKLHHITSVGEIAGKVFYFKDKPQGYIGVPAWVERFVWWIKNKPEFPYEILYNIFCTGNVTLLAPKSETDSTWTFTVPLMGYIVEIWYPRIDPKLFQASLIEEFEKLMKNKDKISLSEQTFGGFVGRDIGNQLIPKVLNPNIDSDTITYLEYAAIGVGALILLGTAGYAAKEIKDVIQ